MLRVHRQPLVYVRGQLGHDRPYAVRIVQIQPPAVMRLVNGCLLYTSEIDKELEAQQSKLRREMGLDK